MAYGIGTTVTVQVVARDLAGTPINTPTVTLTVTAPDGTVAAPITASNTLAGGIYTATVAATQVGTYVLAWVGTGGLADTDQFTVRDAAARLISLGEAKKQLNIPVTTTSDDLELEDYIDTITAVVEDITGPMIRRTIVETLWVTGPTVVLGYAPVITLTSVAAAQTGWTAPLLADLIVDGPTGILRWAAGGYGTVGLMTFTYAAGRTVIPAAVGLAGRIILAHMWETQHNADGGRPAFGRDDLPQPGLGFSVPNRAVELLEPYRRAPAVA